MKKFAAAVVAAVVLTSVAAPAFAQTTIQNCVFKDKALCSVETLSNTKQDD